MADLSLFFCYPAGFEKVGVFTPTPMGFPQLVFAHTCPTPGRRGTALPPQLPCQHGVQQDSQAPDVTRCIIALSLQDLGGARDKVRTAWASSGSEQAFLRARSVDRVGTSAGSASPTYPAVAWTLQTEAQAQCLPGTQF